MLQQRPNTFAQTNLLPHFSLATKRRTIHSGLPLNRPRSCRNPTSADSGQKWGTDCMWF